MSRAVYLTDRIDYALASRLTVDAGALTRISSEGFMDENKLDGLDQGRGGGDIVVRGACFHAAGQDA